MTVSTPNITCLNDLWSLESHFASVTRSDTLGPEIDSKTSYRISWGPQWLMVPPSIMTGTVPYSQFTSINFLHDVNCNSLSKGSTWTAKRLKIYLWELSQKCVLHWQSNDEKQLKYHSKFNSIHLPFEAVFGRQTGKDRNLPCELLVSFR